MERKGQFSGWPSTVLGAPDVEKGKLSLVSSAHLLLNSASLLLFFCFFFGHFQWITRDDILCLSLLFHNHRTRTRDCGIAGRRSMSSSSSSCCETKQMSNSRTDAQIERSCHFNFFLLICFFSFSDVLIERLPPPKIECIFDFWCCQSIRVPLPMASSDDIFFWFLFIFLFSITGHEPKYFFLFPHVFVVVPV